MKSGFNKKNLDTSIRPSDDFFQFASGGWIKNNPIPNSESSWSSFHVLREESKKNLHKILQDLSKNKTRPNSEAEKLKNFYCSGMDTKKLNKEGASPIKEWHLKIKNIKTKNDISKIFGQFMLLSINTAIATMVSLDEKDSSRYALYIYQDGLGLPDREYYLNKNKSFAKIRHKYKLHIASMLEYIGYPKNNSLRLAETVIKMETHMARASNTQEELRQIEKQYNKITIKKLSSLYKNINWKIFFDTAGIKDINTVIVGQPRFVREINKMLDDYSIEQWQIYLSWKLIHNTSNFLSEEIAQKTFEFYGTTIQGIKKIKPRWKRVTMVLDSLVGDMLGKLYVQKYFSKSAKTKINKMADNIICAYEQRIKNLDWMSTKTKKKALEKLHKINKKLAYPEKWINYSALKITEDSYLQNYFKATKFESRRLIAKLKSKADKKEWFMTPPTVNAYYSFCMNDVNFPAGILRPPIFDPDAHDAINYGAIGSVIGHELTHGFDDQGSKFDKNGNMHNWWTKNDRAKFHKKSKALVKQYDEYVAVDNLHVNGKLTLGENIADLAGLCIAFDAFKMTLNKKNANKKIGGFTPEQLFFLGFAQREQGHIRPAEQKRLALIDPHSPSRFRVNGIVSNIDAFYKAFNVGPKDKMYKAPKTRIKIW